MYYLYIGIKNLNCLKLGKSVPFYVFDFEWFM